MNSASSQNGGSFGRQLRTLLARAHDGAFVTTTNGRIVFWNRAAERLLGYRADEVQRRPYTAVFRIDATDPVSGFQYRPIVCDGVIQPFDVHARTKTGGLLCLEMNAVAVEDNGMSAVIYVFRDVTRSKELLREIHETLAARLGRAPRLTDREVDVLRAMAIGLGTRAAAERLRVSPATIRNHTQNIFCKLGVHTRLTAVLYATRCGLL